MNPFWFGINKEIKIKVSSKVMAYILRIGLPPLQLHII